MMFNFRRLGILCKCVLIIIKRLIVKKLKLIKKIDMRLLCVIIVNFL